MSIFDRFKRPDFSSLEDWAVRHEGVEGYLEPQTPTMPQSLLLVDSGGQWSRAPIDDRAMAAKWCRDMGLPIYDAAIVGYPARMKRLRREPSPPPPSIQELEAWYSKDQAEETGEQK